MKVLNGRKCIAGVVLMAECGAVSVSGNDGQKVTKTKEEGAVKSSTSFSFNFESLFRWFLSFWGIGANAKTAEGGKGSFRSKNGAFCVIKYKDKEEDFKSLKGKIKKGELKAGDLIEVTVSTSDDKVLSRDDVRYCVESLVRELNPGFLIFKDQSEYVKYAALDITSSVTLSIKYMGSFDELAVDLQERYDSISSLDGFSEFISFYNTNFCFNFLRVGSDTAYQVRQNIIRYLFSGEIVSTSYTRNDFKLVTSELCQIQDETEKISDKKLQKECFKLLEAAELYKRLVAVSILKENGTLFEVSGGEFYKFNVSGDPRSRALVKYILTAEEMGSGFSDDAYKFLLEKFLIYVLTSRGKIDQSGKNKSLDWEEKEGKEIFSFWLDLKNGKSATDVAFKLVTFLKKYLKEDEIKTIKNKFLKGNIDSRFKEIFEKEGEVVFSDENRYETT